jgi:two-component system sensor histidine kinase BaeS
VSDPPGGGPPSGGGGPPWGDGPPPWASARWRSREGDWHQYRGGASWRRSGGAPWFLGCALVALVLVVALVIAAATWLATALIGVLAPSASPPVVTAVAIALVLVVAVVAFGRLFGAAVRPLAAIADATERLADGEPGVRVEPRGPGPVRRLAGSFNTMAERLDRSRDDRRALLADVTHELRTPLTVVQGGLEAMLDGVHPMDEDHLAPVLAETTVMARLVDDLRTLSLADAGALTLHREPADVAALAREVLAANGPVAAAKGVEVALRGDARVVTEVDPVRIREVLANLVQNALRHTSSGGRVEVDVAAPADTVVITVRDTGSGIAPEDLPRVFDRFHRHADTGGTGLGLAIVRDLIATHGGTVTAESDGIPGHGSTFRVAFPRRG